MGKAERAIRQREDAEMLEALRAAQADVQQMRLNLAELVARVEALVPAALATLADSDWREGTLLTVRSRLGRRKRIAGYAAGQYLYAGRWDSGFARSTRTIYLLSNGKWLYSAEDGPMSFSAVAEWLTMSDMSDTRLSSEPFPGIIKSLTGLAERRRSNRSSS